MPSTILLHVITEHEAWDRSLSKLLPDYKIAVYGQTEFDIHDVLYAVVWAPPEGLLCSLPNLKCVFSIGAGISHITNDPTFPADMPIVRTTGELLLDRMCGYVALHTLRIQRRLSDIEAASKEGKWLRYIAPPAQETTVGILGMGNLGTSAARILKSLGFKVIGLSKSGRPLEGIPVYPQSKTSDFFKAINIAISLLPETKETESIFCNESLSLMPQGSWVINAGRGSQVKDADLIEQLDKNHLAGAVLDVFRKEPLPDDHPFWQHKKILITSHTAGAIDADVGCELIAKNVRAFALGEHLSDLVDRVKGY